MTQVRTFLVATAQVSGMAASAHVWEIRIVIRLWNKATAAEDRKSARDHESETGQIFQADPCRAWLPVNGSINQQQQTRLQLH